MWYLIIGTIINSVFQVSIESGPFSSLEECRAVRDHYVIQEEYKDKTKMCVQIGGNNAI